MGQAPDRVARRAVAPRKSKATALKRLAHVLGPAACVVSVQKQGRALTAHLPQCRAMRGRCGYGRCARRGAVRKMGRLNVPLGKPLRVEYGPARFTFSRRRAGAVADVGLFTLERIRKGAVLGVFTGQEVSRTVALQRRASGAKCIVQFERDGKRVYLDGSKGRTSCFCWLNSSRGSGREANVEFVVIDHLMAVQTLSVVEPDTELLADYDWVRALGCMLLDS